MSQVQILGPAGSVGVLGGGTFGHRDVNIFEDLARRDAEDAVIGLDQIVAFASAVLASEVIDKAECRGELLGVDEESSAVDFPIGCHGVVTLVQFVMLLFTFHGKPLPFLACSGPERAAFFVRSEADFRREMRVGQFSIFGALEDKDLFPSCCIPS